VNTVYSEVLKQLGALYLLKFFLNRTTLSRICLTFILPILEYGCELWDGCSNEDSKKLQDTSLDFRPIMLVANHYILERDGNLFVLEENGENCVYYIKYEMAWILTICQIHLHKQLILLRLITLEIEIIICLIQL